MANTSSLSGLSPVRYLNGAPWTGGGNLYSVLASDANILYVGDLVTTIGNAGSDANGIPAVTLAAAGAAARGVILAIGPSQAIYADPTNLTAVNKPASDTRVFYCLVADDPNILFEIQEGGVHAALTSASVNRNANINTGTRTASLILSPAYMDNNTVNTTSTLNLKLFGLSQKSDNAFGANSKWLCLINNHELRTGTTAP